MDKENVARCTVKYYSAIKGKLESSVGKSMYFDSIMLSEEKQAQ